MIQRIGYGLNVIALLFVGHSWLNLRVGESISQNQMFLAFVLAIVGLIFAIWRKSDVSDVVWPHNLTSKERKRFDRIRQAKHRDAALRYD